jgi:hypothetical protein
VTQSTLSGSCLCGAVQYEVSGDPQWFYHCHCWRCRKASGTGHASNLFVTSGTLTWAKGEELIKSYKIPEAKRFTNCFCIVCGGRVPRYVKETEMIVIPAGSIDSDLAFNPQFRIFWDSRASWSCGGDDIPVHSEYPT